MDPVKSWIINEKLDMSEHLKMCPYNIRTCHDGHGNAQNDENWNEVLRSLLLKLQMKRMKETPNCKY